MRVNTLIALAALLIGGCLSMPNSPVTRTTSVHRAPSPSPTHVPNPRLENVRATVAGFDLEISGHMIGFEGKRSASGLPEGWHLDVVIDVDGAQTPPELPWDWEVFDVGPPLGWQLYDRRSQFDLLYEVATEFRGNSFDFKILLSRIGVRDGVYGIYILAPPMVQGYGPQLVSTGTFGNPAWLTKPPGAGLSPQTSP
jgi:hypothetical protein